MAQTEIQRAWFLGVAATIGADVDEIEKQRLVRQAVARGTWRR